MDFVKELTRDEMKNVMAGAGNDCGTACNNFGGDCYGSCFDAFQPHEDMWGYCVDTCNIQVDNCLTTC